MNHDFDWQLTFDVNDNNNHKIKSISAEPMGKLLEDTGLITVCPANLGWVFRKELNSVSQTGCFRSCTPLSPALTAFIFERRFVVKPDVIYAAECSFTFL